MSDLLRRVAVIGATGQLGSDLIRALDGVDVVGVDHTVLDVERTADVVAWLEHTRPSLVVNTAAYHNVERCEANADRAFAVNAIAVDGLAAACEAAGVAIAHISTDYVFDGKATTPYDEGARAAPLNVYGVSKYAGELAIAARTERAFVFRTSGLYGVRGSSEKGHTFVEKIRSQALAGKPLRVVDDVVTTPSYTLDVATTMRRVFEAGRFGTYHVTNAGSCSWYEFAVAILAASGIEADVERTTSAAFPSPVRRPQYSVLANNAVVRIGLTAAPTWSEGLHAYLRTGTNTI